MFTEKHILTNPYNHHKLSRTLTGFDVTTVECNADKSSGWNGTTVNLTPNAVADTQKFSGWSSTGANITNSSFNFAGSDVTAKANFETAKDITLQTDGHGKISANKSYGFVGDIITLSNTASANYEFTGYSITGATLTGSQFTIGTGNVTAKAGYNINIDSITIGTQTWMSKNLAFDDGSYGIYTADINISGSAFGTQYYYTKAAANRVANLIDGWHLPTDQEIDTLRNYLGTASAGAYLKSTYGWSANNGLDTYGFTLFPFGDYNITAATMSARDVARYGILMTSAGNTYAGTYKGNTFVSIYNVRCAPVRLIHD